MKYLVLLAPIFLAGCAATAIQAVGTTMSTINVISKVQDNNKPKGGIPYEQLAAIKVTQANCVGIDQNIEGVNQQLKLRGVYGKNPEDLDEEDRKYNQTGKIIIWSMIIGCNNPDRYAKK